MPTITKTAAVKKEVAKAYAFPFTLGADPEFTIISGTRPINAREILSTFIGTDFPLDPPSSPNGFKMPGGNIGWDGHNATGEVRPKPGSPREVTANLKSMFSEVQKRIPFVDLNTLTIAQPTGGHIHVSIPEEMTGDLERMSSRMQAIQRALGSFLLTIMIGENKLSRDLRRRGGSYGSLLDFRQEQRSTYPSGIPLYSMEIRAATAEWITTEKICLGTLAYMAICWDRIIQSYNGDKSALKPVAEIIFPSQKAANDNLPSLLANYANLQKLYLNKIKPFVRSHPAYNEYKDALELVMNPERLKAEKKAAHYSITEGWGLSKDIKSIKTADFTNADSVEEKSSKFPESVIRNLSQFAWNDDINVQSFATALGKRCVALGWKPNHEYFLFGLKKGMDALILRDEEGNFLSGEEIIKTKKDFTTIKSKFERLAPKATPTYGRFIHPRTGTLMEDGEAKRVMIGIPHDMRQKMDMKQIVKLVLKYEKTPKSMSPITPDSLPEGASKIEAEMQVSEQKEASFTKALSSGDKPRELHEDDIRAAREESRSIGEASRTIAISTNLASWIEREGNFAFSYAANFRHDIATSPIGGLRTGDLNVADDNDILGWYTGDYSTIVNFGHDNEALDVIASIFQVDVAALLSFWVSRSHRRDQGILTLGNSGNLRFDNATKNDNIRALIQN